MIELPNPRGILSMFAALILMAGCSRSHDPVSSDKMASSALDSAPADLKAQWQTAVQCFNHKDYLASERAMAQVLSNQDKLTPDQNTALQNAWLLLGTEAFKAADKGDDKATKAVLEMRDSPFGKSAR